MDALRATGRFAGCVLATTGVFLLADAGATVAWQEPVSALHAAREQHALSEDLASRFAAIASSPPSAPSVTPAALGRTAARYRAGLHAGSAVGRIRLPSLHGSFVIVQGTDTATLRRGPGHYPGTALPGEHATVAIAGHRTTYLAPFRSIDRLGKGASVVLEMPYGRFIYRVQRHLVVAPDAQWVTRRAGYERLVLTACHPLHSAARRLVVFAQLTAVQPAVRR